MKYIDKNSNIKRVETDVVNSLMESLGYTVPTPQDDLIGSCLIGEDIFGLTADYLQDEGGLYIKLSEVADSHVRNVNEGNAELETAFELEDVEYNLTEDVYEIDGDYYVQAVCENIYEADEQYVMEFEGNYYNFTDEDSSDFVAYLQEDENGEFTLVDDEASSDYIAHLSEMDDITEADGANIKKISVKKAAVPGEPNAMKGINPATRDSGASVLNTKMGTQGGK